VKATILPAVSIATWYCILSAEFIKKRTTSDCFLAILPAGAFVVNRFQYNILLLFLGFFYFLTL